MVATFFSVYTPQWHERADDLGFTLQQVVTLASMIEKEAAVPSERTKVSSVFHNRLIKRMRLQSDPTVIYGDPEFEGRILTRHLQRKTEYNTYQMHGLPKGPLPTPAPKPLRRPCSRLTPIFCILCPETTEPTIFKNPDGTQPGRQTIPAEPVMLEPPKRLGCQPGGLRETSRQCTSMHINHRTNH